MKKIAILVMMLAAQSLWAGTLTLTGNVTLNNESDSKAVDYAVKSFRQDIQRKLGLPKRGRPAVPFTFKIAEKSDIFDQHSIAITDKGVTITGSDELGLIHGIYSFSEDTLGIDPCIYFTGVVPKQVQELQLKTGSTQSRPYTFKHRVMFVNDEDLIIGFQMEKLSYGMNMEFMEKLFETMLRLKMTGVIPSTLVLADEPHLVLASEMGLYIAQHHAEPLGSVPLYWPKRTPYSWSTHKEHFIKFWSDAIKRQKGKNVIWTLNFRGLLDRAFWDDDPTMSHDSSREEKAKVVNDVINTQYELLKELTGEEHPLVCGYLWGELGGLYRTGLLDYPEDTMLLLNDSGHGIVSNWKWDLAKKSNHGSGVYQHVSYHCHRTHIRINTIHPDVFQEQMGKAVESGATDMIVLNVGNFKEKIFGIRQVVNYMNHYEDYAQHKDGDWYFDWYAKHQLGTTEAAVAESYRNFFGSLMNLSDVRKKPGDEYYAYYVDRVLKMIYEHDLDERFFKEITTKKETAKIAKMDFHEGFAYGMKKMPGRLHGSEDRWQVSVEQAYDNRRFLKGNALEFYNVDLVYPSLKMMHLTGAAADFTDAANFYLEKEYHKSQLAAHQALLHARAALKTEQLIEQSGWGRFDDWYEHDENARTWAIEMVLEHFIDHVKDLKFLHLDYHWRNSKTPGLDYKYQPWFESEYNGELIYMNNAE